MNNWIKKDGYDTCIVATEQDLNSPGTEIQLFCFHQGKFSHYHRCKTEFFYFTAGNGRAEIDGQEQKLTPGSVVVVKPNVRHTFINDSTQQLLEGIMVKTNNDPKDTFRD